MKQHDLNDLKLLHCENCDRTSRILFPTAWKLDLTFNISHVCPRCLWEWVKIGQFDEEFGKNIRATMTKIKENEVD